MDKISNLQSELSNLLETLISKGSIRILAKELSENDNPKNQIYFGQGFSSLNQFPNLNIRAATSGTHLKPIFKAPLKFSWLGGNGSESPAPYSQLIFYPQYPEVRFSGFLKGCKKAPSELMNSRIRGRILFLGICEDGRIYAQVVDPDSPIAGEYREKKYPTTQGVFSEIPFIEEKDPDNLFALIECLKDICDKGWIRSYRLNRIGNEIPCENSNCGGYTLEALLGIKPNGYSEPDFLGWEIKQFNVNNLENMNGGIITLMTPEPKGGVYSDEGMIRFVMKYGYPDTSGKKERKNFGGIHRYGVQHPKTKLTLTFSGYESGKITDSSGYMGLVDPSGRLAAAWYFADLLKHWNCKHNRAAYIPSNKRNEPDLEYRFSHIVRLCRGTDFTFFLEAVKAGHVYYDPGIKVEQCESSHPVTKRRSQFRIKSTYIPDLYKDSKITNLAI